MSDLSDSLIKSLHSAVKLLMRTVYYGNRINSGQLTISYRS